MYFVCRFLIALEALVPDATLPDHCAMYIEIAVHEAVRDLEVMDHGVGCMHMSSYLPRRCLNTRRQM